MVLSHLATAIPSRPSNCFCGYLEPGTLYGTPYKAVMSYFSKIVEASFSKGLWNQGSTAWFSSINEKWSAKWQDTMPKFHKIWKPLVSHFLPMAFTYLTNDMLVKACLYYIQLESLPAKCLLPLPLPLHPEPLLSRHPFSFLAFCSYTVLLPF